MSTFEVQRQIKENSTELQDFLHDLTTWEHTVKEKEKKLVGSASKTVPTVGGKTQSSLDKEDGVRIDAEKNVSKKAAAAHTYDYFRDKWDKFDVDAALAEVDEAPQKPSPKKVARTSKAKAPAAAKVKVDEKPPTSTTTLPASNTYGNTRGSSSSSLASFASSYGLEDGPVPDAMSEKDLGNEYFKEGKYVKAIECYSRSIALQPTAVAFANRAMALLKIRRYADAEVDCTEAIALDDRYTKAYSRRGTARKELQKYFIAVEDFEFALRLEPENKELKKQFNEAKEIYEKFAAKTKSAQKKFPILVEEMSDTSRSTHKTTAQASPKISPRTTAKSSEHSDITLLKADHSNKSTDYSSASATRKLDERKPASPVSATRTRVADSSLSNPDGSSFKTGNAPVNRNDAGSSASGAEKTSINVFSRPSSATKASVTPTEPATSKVVSSTQPTGSDDILAWSRRLDASRPPSSEPPSTHRTKLEEPLKQSKKVGSKATAEVAAPSQAAVERAAVNARAGLARNMVAPKTAYEFEATWKGFANDRQSQSRLLKIMEPSSLPKVFKDLLGAPLLMDIMNSLPLLLPDDARLVLRILENLVKVGRFDMTILFLTAKDKTVIRKLWEDLLATEELSINEETKLNGLRSKYKF